MHFPPEQGPWGSLVILPALGAGDSGSNPGGPISEGKNYFYNCALTHSWMFFRFSEKRQIAL